MRSSPVSGPVRFAIQIEITRLGTPETRAIVTELERGRVTPRYLACKLCSSRPSASEQSKRFLEHEHDVRLASGLSELVDVTQEDDESNTQRTICTDSIGPFLSDRYDQ
ncbi:hypothetical protein [Natrinema caseinilyticum]|uniref:hypothetical protein n=1 Tax=Natrinema caseinilyticum TaxID=2961570 RepID=UPI0020C2D7DB|nr:hypothetical protein [Natrinema caseinilyticum]